MPTSLNPFGTLKTVLIILVSFLYVLVLLSPLYWVLAQFWGWPKVMLPVIAVSLWLVSFVVNRILYLMYDIWELREYTRGDFFELGYSVYYKGCVQTPQISMQHEGTYAKVSWSDWFTLVLGSDGVIRSSASKVAKGFQVMVISRATKRVVFSYSES